MRTKRSKRKVRLVIYRTQIRPSEHDIVATYQVTDLTAAENQEFRHGF